MKIKNESMMRQQKEQMGSSPQDAPQDEFIDEDLAELGPGQEAQLEAYRTNATDMIFDEENKPAILQSLQASDNPVEALGNTAFLVHNKLESSLEETGEEMTEITLVLGAGHVVSELVILADAEGLYQLTPDERLQAFRHGAMKYLEAGIANGSIDPVALQKTIEPLLTEEQKSFGMQQAEEQRLSKTAPPSDFFQSGNQQGGGEMSQPPQRGILRGGR